MLRKIGVRLIGVVYLLSLLGCGSSASFSGMKNRDPNFPYIDNCIGIARKELEEDGLKIKVTSRLDNYAHISGSSEVSRSGGGLTEIVKEGAEVDISVGKGVDKYGVSCVSSHTISGASENFVGVQTTVSGNSYGEMKFLEGVGENYERKVGD